MSVLRYVKAAVELLNFYGDLREKVAAKEVKADTIQSNISSI